MKLKAQWQEFRKTAWDSRAPRERRVMAAGAVVLAPVVGFFLLWQPAHEAVAKLQHSLPLMRMQAAQMQRQAAEVDTLRQRAQPALLNPTAMKSAVESSAVAFGLRNSIESLDGVEPNGVRISFSSVPYGKWLEWTRSLQRDQHFRVDTLSVVALPTEGMVKISVTLVNGVNK